MKRSGRNTDIHNLPLDYSHPLTVSVGGLGGAADVNALPLLDRKGETHGLLSSPKVLLWNPYPPGPYAGDGLLRPHRKHKTVTLEVKRISFTRETLTQIPEGNSFRQPTNHSLPPNKVSEEIFHLFPHILKNLKIHENEFFFFSLSSLKAD